MASFLEKAIASKAAWIATDREKPISWEREGCRDVGRFSNEYRVCTDIGDQYVIVKENFGDCGNRVWDASVLMGKFFEKQSHLIRGKTVLEIGCGTGLTGVFLCLAGGIVTLTERQPTIEKLKETVEINGVKDKCIVRELDWISEQQLKEIKDEKFDIIVGSDITICERDANLVINVLQQMATKECDLYIASSEQREGYSHFLSLAAEKFEIEYINENDLHPDYLSKKIKVMHLKLK